MSAAEAVIRRFYELSSSGDPACWRLWADDATSAPPSEWPESDEARGVEQISRAFTAWASVFGERFWEGISLEAVTELPDGRVLADVAFHLEGQRSGAPFHKNGAVIYTVREGRIARAEHFMDRETARQDAGL